MATSKTSKPRRTKGTGGLRSVGGDRWELKWLDKGKVRYQRVRVQNVATEKWLLTWRDGSDQYPGKTAQRAAAARLNELTAGAEVAQKAHIIGYPFKDYAREFVIARKKGKGPKKKKPKKLAPGTWAEYDRIVEGYLIVAFGDDLLHVLADDVGPIEDYRDGLLGDSDTVDLEKMGWKVLAPNTVRNHLRLLSMIFDGAEDDGLIARNPMRSVWVPGGAADEAVVLTMAEATALIAHVPPRYRMLTRLLLATGMRIGEALALRWDDYDPPDLRIGRALRRQDGNWVVGSPKTKNSKRTLRLDEPFMDALDAHREAQADHPNPLGLMFPNERGSYLDGNNFRNRALKKGLAAAKIDKPLTVHGLRHTHASLSIKKNVNPKVLSARLGHASVAFTLDVYGHLYAAEAGGSALDVLSL